MKTRLQAPDLYGYLVSLASSLERAGNEELAKQALRASDLASRSGSELFGAAEAFLSDLVRSGAPGLSKSEVDRLRYVLNGIAEESEGNGGA
jgi:hypothetical protein